jgi:rhomboid protease GluP
VWSADNSILTTSSTNLTDMDSFDPIADSDDVVAELRESQAKTADDSDVRPLWDYPATYVLVGINLIVFLAECWHTPIAGAWRHHVWSEMFTSMVDVNQLERFGGSASEMILHQGEWWRLFTAIFVHVNVLHLLVNLWCLWNLGLFGEPLLGRSGMVSVYVLTGVAGNVLALAWGAFTKTDSLVAGASGAVFGLAGILIILLSNRQLALPWEELRSLRRQVIFFAVANLASGYLPMLLPLIPANELAKVHVDLATMPRIGNLAHIGGFLCGLLLGLPLFPRMTSGRSSYRIRQRVTYTAAAFLLCLVTYAVVTSAKS